MDTARKEMMIELLKDNVQWDKVVEVEVTEDIIIIYDNCFEIISRALLESVQDVVKAFGLPYYIAVRDNKAVINIVLK